MLLCMVTQRKIAPLTQQEEAAEIQHLPGFRIQLV